MKILLQDHLLLIHKTLYFAHRRYALRIILKITLVNKI